LSDSGKCIILCEGSHDLIFVSELLLKNKHKYKKATQSRINSYQRNGQKREIDSFLKNNRYKYLIKEEMNGIDCINCFFSLIKNKFDYRVMVVVDSDGDHLLKVTKEKAKKEFHKNDFLTKISNNGYKTINENYYAFYYPNRLTDEIKNSIGKDISHIRGEYSQKKIIKKFLETSDSIWISELEAFLCE
jgi:hypothetical protein